MTPNHTPSATLLLLFALLPGVTQATTRTWPGIAPCNSTLAACIGASGTGDRVLIATDGPIQESVVLLRAVSLIAAPGVAPRFAAGHSIGIQVADASPWTLQLTGLTLLDGKFDVSSLTSGSVTLDRVSVLDTTGAGVGIVLSAFAPPSAVNDARFVIRECRVRVRNRYDTGISVYAANSTQVGLDLHMADNLIEAAGAAEPPAPGSIGRTGIRVTVESGRNSTVEIARNRIMSDPLNIEGGARLGNGIGVAIRGSAGAVALRVLDNVATLRRDASSFYAAGFTVNAETGAPQLRVLNNTFIGSQNGIRIERFGSDSVALTGTLANNLVADHVSGIVFQPRSLEAGVSNSHNALFANAANAFTPGPGTITADPQLLSVRRPRLRAESPLRDAGSPDARAAAGPGALPPPAALDADGLRRVKGAMPDVGAFEFGDASIVHTNGQFSSVTVLDDPAINGRLDRVLQVTRSGGLAPDDLTPNPRPMSQRYPLATGRWELFADDGFNLNIGAGFHIFSPETGPGRALHYTQAGNITSQFTALEPALTSLPPDTIMQVTHTRGADGNTNPNPRPAAAVYVFGLWYIMNLDQAPMPVGVLYAIYAQPPSRNAYVHTADASNQPVASVTVLDHPLLNGAGCAAPHVTLSGNAGLNPHPIGVRYDSAAARWYIRNEDGAALPANSQYFVVVHAQSVEARCADALFADGYE